MSIRAGAVLKLTDGMLDSIVFQIAIGETLAVASERCSVSVRAITQWQKQGRIDKEAGFDSIFARFATRMEAARLVKRELFKAPNRRLKQLTPAQLAVLDAGIKADDADGQHAKD